MRVSIISAFDPIPGDDAQLIRYASLAHIFAQHNHIVHYFSSSFFHLNKTQRVFNSWQDSNFDKNIKLQLIRTNSYKKNISVRRLINHFSFAFKLKQSFKKHILQQKPDLVIVAFPPVLSAHSIVKLCNQNNIKVVVDVQDLWPDAFRMIIRNRLIYKLVSHWLLLKRNAAFRNANYLSAVSETYKHLLAEYQPTENIYHANLGINIKLFQQNFSQEWDMIKKDPSEKWIVFLGTASHNPDLLNITTIAAQMPDDRFILLGRNESYGKIQNDITSKKLNNLLLIGNTTFHNIVNILFRCNAALLFIDKRSGTSLPNKLFYYLLAGLPIISNYKNTDLEYLAETLNCIFFTDPSNNDDFTDSIQKAVAVSSSERNNFRTFALENFDSENIYNRYYNWITKNKT